MPSLYCCVLFIAMVTQPASFRVSGVVTDPSGASVPGANVKLLDAVGRELNEAATDVAGSFHFENVPQGQNFLEIRHEDFKLRSVKLELGRQPQRPLRITLEIAELQQGVTVTGEQEQVSTQSAENLDVVELDRELLDNLPVLDQDILGAASEFLDPGAIGSEGYSLVVDGLETTDVGVSASAIQEVQINKNPYSAEFSRPGRGRIEVITKQGNPEFHGTLNVLFRDHRLNARNAFAATRSPEQRRIFEGHITGPLGNSGKTTFVASAEYVQDNEWSLVYGRTLSGVVQEQRPQPDRETEYSFRVNRQSSETHSWSLRYELEKGSSRGSGVGGFTLPETAYDRQETEHDIRFSNQFVIGPSLVNQFHARIRRDDEETVSRLTGVPKIVVLDAFTSGSAQQDETSSHYRGEFGEILSWSHGKHFLRIGALVPYLARRASNDMSGRFGTFRFSSLADYEAGEPYSFTRQIGNGRVVFWKTEFAGFVQDEFRIQDNLSLGLGLRYEAHSHPSDRNDFAPRLSVAWAPGKQRSTVIRAGAGLFYDRMWSSPVRDALLLDGSRLRRVLLSFPSYPDPFSNGAEITEQPATIVQFEPELATPRLYHFNLGVEHQLWKRTTLAITYSGYRGNGLYRSRDLNAPVPPAYVRSDPEVGVLQQIESSGALEGNGFNVNLRGYITRFFQGGVLYRYGRMYNDTGGVFSFPADNYDLSGEWGRAGHDRRHRFFEVQVLIFNRCTLCVAVT